MKFLLDENVPLSVKNWFETRGFNAVRVSEVGLKGADDEKIFEYALKNDHKIITLDLDFGYLSMSFGKGTVIVLRPDKAIPSEVLNLLERSFDAIKDRDGLIVVRSTKIRVIELSKKD